MNPGIWSVILLVMLVAVFEIATRKPRKRSDRAASLMVCSSATAAQMTENYIKRMGTRKTRG